MCVIIHAAAKQTISKDILQTCYENNPDGWGIMWAEKGQVNAIKDVSSFEEFYKNWRNVPRYAERGVHFRIKTHGTINKQNCHPFLPSRNVGIMHNGVIDTALIEKEMSDTFNFVKYEVKPLIEAIGDGFIESEDFKELMDKVTGYSKLLFINGKGQIMRTRDSAWHKHEGLYFSNQHSLNKRNYHKHSGTYCHIPSKPYQPVVSSSNSNTSSGYRNNYEPLKTEGTPDWRDDKFWDKNGEVKKEWKNNVVSISKNEKGEEPEFTENNVVSDLHSGNKTEAEGKSYIDRMEVIQQEDMEAERLALEEALRRENEEEINTNPSFFDEDDKDPEVYFDLQELAEMSFEDILDAVQDYPKSVAYTLRGLVDTCLTAGILKLPITDVGIESLSDKAVNT